MKVVRGGLLTTIQDLGRRGFQQYGVGRGGAMDRFALRVANRLVGNPAGSAALEITLTGPSLEFERESVIAICGGDLPPALGSDVLPSWRPVRVSKGSTLTFGACVGGCRAYLAVAGGIDVPEVLESRSTHLRAHFGGLDGRALHSGDTLAAGRPSETASRLLQRLGSPAPWSTVPWSLSSSMLPRYQARAFVRAIRGEAFDRLAREDQQQVFEATFTITRESDRMGYRTAGPALRLVEPVEQVSEPVCPGTVQLPPEGRPVVLMADCQTTGGYPRIAHVISADLPVLAQLKPGDTFRFRQVTLDEAQDIVLKAEREWRELEAGIERQLERL